MTKVLSHKTGHYHLHHNEAEVSDNVSEVIISYILKGGDYSVVTITSALLHYIYQHPIFEYLNNIHFKFVINLIKNTFLTTCNNFLPAEYVQYKSTCTVLVSFEFCGLK